MINHSKSVILKDITKQYIGHGKKEEFTAVDNISLEIKSGEFITLLGPSGCGKTTTLRMVAGFEIPSAGDIYIGDQKINNLPPEKRDTAMVFQSYALFPHYNIFDNVAYGLKLKKSSKKDIEKKVLHILELVGLQGLGDRAPNQISGGQQQRVALARALVMEPSVLLFDEPLSNLDAKLRVYMRTEIRKIQQRLGITSIYVTHDQSEAMSLSDRIIIMNKGKIEQIGTPEEVYQTPASEFVADFIGVANLAEGKINAVNGDNANVEVFGVNIDIPIKNAKFKAGDQVKVISRPEGLTVGTEGVFDGLVKFSAFMGSYQEYHIDIQGKNFIIQETNPAGKKIFTENERVKINFYPNSLHLIKA